MKLVMFIIISCFIFGGVCMAETCIKTGSNGINDWKETTHDWIKTDNGYNCSKCGAIVDGNPIGDSKPQNRLYIEKKS